MMRSVVKTAAYVAATAVTEINGTALPVTYPPYVVGDALIAVISTSDANAPPTPTGWTRVLYTFSGNLYTNYCYTTTPATATNGFTASSGAVLIMVVRNASLASFINASAAGGGSSGGTSTASLTLPALSTTVSKCLILGCWSLQGSTASLSNAIANNGASPVGVYLPVRNSAAGIFSTYVGTSVYPLGSNYPDGTLSATVTTNGWGYGIFAITPL